LGSRRALLIKLLVILIVVIIGFIAYAPPNAGFMPEEKRFVYVTFPLLPPLIAIAMAIATGQVLPALFFGVWIGALMVVAYNPISATMKALGWVVENVTDSWNATILLFDFVIGAYVGLLYVSGSMHSLVEALSRNIRSGRGSSLVATLLGTIVFFDDYANTIVVGNTMRPLTDRTRVSRELLSYIIDSTAAPVAGLLFVSTWIGYEVGLINDAIESLKKAAVEGSIVAAPGIEAYALWLKAWPYHFYSILALLLVYLVVIFRRHFGPMYHAELRAVKEGKVLRDGAQPLMPTETVLGEPAKGRKASAWLFIASVITLIAVTLLSMWYTGAGAVDPEAPWWTISFGEALMGADAATSLLWGSFAAYLVVLAGVLACRTLGFAKAMEYTVKGMYTMLYANTILVLAWSIKTATDAIGTAEYVVTHAVGAGVPALLVPLIIFAVSMFISYTTGTSWGTFGVMMPLAVPLAWQLALQQFSIEMAYIVTAAAIGAVFGGGIYGDHVSPISDTTIMSSMFSGADHIDHVKTQLPYGTLAASIAITLYILFFAGLTNWQILLPIGIALLVILYLALSKPCS